MSQPRAALFAALVVLGALGLAVSALVSSVYPLAFGLGCAPLFLLPEHAAARHGKLGHGAAALVVLGCWVLAACWMLVISFGAAYTAEAAASPGALMPWSALVDWQAEVARQPGLTCFSLGLMSWPGALEIGCRLRPAMDRLGAHAVGLLAVAVAALGWLSHVHEHLGGLRWASSSGVFVVFAIPGEHGIWFVCMLAVLVVSAGVTQAIRGLTPPVARLLRSEGSDDR